MMTYAVGLAVAVAVRIGMPASHAADSLRLIASTGATCHSFPDDEAPIATHYHLGDVVSASTSAQGQGVLWYFDAWRVKGISPTCWVRASATVPLEADHHDAAYAAIVDRLLARDTTSFETLVAVENLLVAPNPYSGAGMDRPPFEASGLLRYKRLLLIERAASLLRGMTIADAPLKQAWVLAHGDILYYHDPSAMWFVANDKFWAVYDANRNAPWAGELASYAAQRNPPSGDECDADCYLWMLTQGSQQYWMRLPNGPTIAKALTIATQFADDAIQGIGEGPPTRPALDTVRKSLTRVVAPEKQALLDRLVRLQRAVKP